MICDKALFNWDWKMDPDHHWYESKSFEFNMKRLQSRFSQMRTYDIKDFDLSFVEGLSLEDGAATLTSYTAAIISNAINRIGSRGKIIESQAFAYLAVRSYLKLPISFPDTTGCSKPCIGGVIVKNF